ncbi:dysbindin domain-containing protein 2 [Brachyhypopomus gauderio]|uniref:dysbindin domain-containing protein 2 n=1 Tax=Brachyhypopomus gauderio TaxID=698409 RepID=UPI004040FEEB
MSSKGTSLHTNRLSLETERSLRLQDTEASQQLMEMRERQRFFEEVFQHDADVYLSPAHLHVDYKRPPIGSISSMEVNVDMLELLDISDPEALDVFLGTSGEDDAISPPLQEVDCTSDGEEALGEEIFLRVPDSNALKSRMSSTSSSSTSDSQATNEDGAETPVNQSDDEDVPDDDDNEDDCLSIIVSPTVKFVEEDQPVLPSAVTTD